MSEENNLGFTTCDLQSFTMTPLGRNSLNAMIALQSGLFYFQTHKLIAFNLKV